MCCIFSSPSLPTCVQEGSRNQGCFRFIPWRIPPEPGARTTQRIRQPPARSPDLRDPRPTSQADLRSTVRSVTLKQQENSGPRLIRIELLRSKCAGFRKKATPSCCWDQKWMRLCNFVDPKQKLLQNTKTKLKKETLPEQPHVSWHPKSCVSRHHQLLTWFCGLSVVFLSIRATYEEGPSYPPHEHETG